MQIFLLFARRLNFSFNKFSIFIKSALHALDRSIAAHPKFLANHPNESLVVRDENYAAGKFIDRLAERFNCLDVEMICRLVENQKVWICHAHFSESNSRFLPSAQARDNLKRQISAHTKTSQLSSILLDWLAWKFILHQLDAVDVHVELIDVMLTKIAEFKTSMVSDEAGSWS